LLPHLLSCSLLLGLGLGSSLSVGRGLSSGSSLGSSGGLSGGSGCCGICRSRCSGDGHLLGLAGQGGHHRLGDGGGQRRDHIAHQSRLAAAGGCDGVSLELGKVLLEVISLRLLLGLEGSLLLCNKLLLLLLGSKC